MSTHYHIRRAVTADLGALPQIERAAATMFLATQHPGMAAAPLATEHLAADDVIWVAADESQQPVAFVVVRPLGDALHVHELDVHPAHARQRLGAKLIAAVARWARDDGIASLTLSTSDDIPWNGPYYARLGFRALSLEQLTPELQQIRKVETATGLPMAHRVCMRLSLSEPCTELLRQAGI